MLEAPLVVEEHGLGGLGAGVPHLAARGPDLGLEHGEEEHGLLEVAAADGAPDLMLPHEALYGLSPPGLHVLHARLVLD